MSRERGFTLIEVLVAFAIAALALAVLFRSSGTALTSSRAAVQYQEALSRARSHLAAIGTGVLEPGEQSGDDGDGYRWRLTVQPAGTAVVQAAPPPTTAPPPTAEADQALAPPEEGPDTAQPVNVTLFAVEVGISWNADGRAREVVLRTDRLSGAPPPP